MIKQGVIKAHLIVNRLQFRINRQKRFKASDSLSHENLIICEYKIKLSSVYTSGNSYNLLPVTYCFSF